jgi:probable phosphomutase (TIGR03848 family)
MTTFYLIRHAATDLVGHTLAGRSPGVHLNDEGRRQAERLADRLAHEPIARVYCSPLERARETAQPLCDRLGLAPSVAEELHELDFGEWTGQTVAALDSSSPLWRRFNAFRSGTRTPGGEMMLEAQARVVGFMQRQAEASPDQTLALVSHGDVIRAAVLHYLGAPLDLFHRIEISPASCSLVRIGEYGPQLLSLNQVSP